MARYRIISSDSHVTEPPDVWALRVGPKFKDRAPHIVQEKDGDSSWVCDGKKMSGVSGGSEAGRRFLDGGKIIPLKHSFEDNLLGGYIPEEHVKDMDADGVDAGLLYPTTGLGLYRSVSDSELLTALFRAYNDWLAEFCQPYPDRLKGIAMINLDDLHSGVKELKRCAKMGLPGAMITVYPHGRSSYDSPEYETLWATAQDLGIPLSLHFHTNRPDAGEEFSFVHAGSRSEFTNIDHWVRMSLADMIFSGVFERYPGLKVGAVEHELSWVPHFLDRMDYRYTQVRIKEGDHRFKDGILPSDYFHSNVFLSFQEDGVGVRLRDIIGTDKLLWGSDYPHPETTFPRSQQILEEILADCTEEEKAKIAGGNAARIYGF